MKSTIALAIVAILSQSSAHAFHFLNGNEINVALFPSPPAVDSKEETAELTISKFLQQMRSANDCARASSEAVSVDIKTFFGAPYGPLTAEEVEIGRKLYSKISADADEYVGMLKARFNKPRPYLISSEIHPCVPAHPASTYPSGHSAIAESTARYLGDLFPKKKELLLQRARQIAFDRVLGGVHHTSDIFAGIKLGDETYEALLKNSSFQAALKE